MELRSFNRVFVVIFEEGAVFSSQKLSVAPHWSNGMMSFTWCARCGLLHAMRHCTNGWLSFDHLFLHCLELVGWSFTSERCIVGYSARDVVLSSYWYGMHHWIWFFMQLRDAIYDLFPKKKKKYKSGSCSRCFSPQPKANEAWALPLKTSWISVGVKDPQHWKHRRQNQIFLTHGLPRKWPPVLAFFNNLKVVWHSFGTKRYIL